MPKLKARKDINETGLKVPPKNPNRSIQIPKSLRNIRFTSKHNRYLEEVRVDTFSNSFNPDKKLLQMNI